MADVTQLLQGNANDTPQSRTVSGFVTAPLPTAFGQPLYVLLPDISHDVSFGPCQWGTAQGQTLPVQGTPVLVVFDDHHLPTVVWFAGTATFPPSTATGPAGGVLSGTYPNPGMAAGAASTNVGSLGGVLGGTLPNPSMAVGAASTNVGTLGGDLTGTLPSPTIASGRAAANIGTLGGELAGTLPNPTLSGTLAAGRVFTWGGDTNLYRGAASTLRTDSVFNVGSEIYGGSYIRSRDGTANAVIMGYDGAGGIGLGPAISFGAAYDASIYRTAANALRTPGSWTVGDALNVSGLATFSSTGNHVFGNGTTGGILIGDGSITKTAGTGFILNSWVVANGVIGSNGNTPQYSFDTSVGNYSARFGVAFMGTWNNSLTYAQFTHQSVAGNISSYALLQDSTGNTYLNSASGQITRFRINNADIAQVAANGFYTTGYIGQGYAANTALSYAIQTTTTIGAASFVTTSDRKLKTNIKPLDTANSLAVLHALNPVRFTHTSFKDRTIHGLIAQEVEAILPDAVFGQTDLEGNREGALLGVDYNQIVPHLIAAIQHIDQRLTKLGA